MQSGLNSKQVDSQCSRSTWPPHFDLTHALDWLHKRNEIQKANRRRPAIAGPGHSSWSWSWSGQVCCKFTCQQFPIKYQLNFNLSCRQVCSFGQFCNCNKWTKCPSIFHMIRTVYTARAPRCRPAACGWFIKPPLRFQVVWLMIRFAWLALQLAPFDRGIMYRKFSNLIAIYLRFGFRWGFESHLAFA